MKMFACAVAVAALAGAAQADLVTNGGFETGDFSGWTQFGDTSFTGVFLGSFDGVNPAEGSYQSYYGPTGSGGGVEQTLAVAAGTPLHITFFYAALGSSNSFSADLGGTNLVSFTDDTSHTSYTQFTFDLNAPSDNPLLSFTFFNPPSYDLLDGVSANVAPAPGSLALLGLGGFAATRRRRR